MAATTGPFEIVVSLPDGMVTPDFQSRASSPCATSQRSVRGVKGKGAVVVLACLPPEEHTRKELMTAALKQCPDLLFDKKVTRHTRMLCVSPGIQLMMKWTPAGQYDPALEKLVQGDDIQTPSLLLDANQQRCPVVDWEYLAALGRGEDVQVGQYIRQRNAGYRIGMTGVQEEGGELKVQKDTVAKVLRDCVCEFLLTTIFVFVGLATVLLNDASRTPSPGQAGLFQVSLSFGFAIAILAAAGGGYSGAHINPAVTVGLFISGRVVNPWRLLYVVFQMGGAVLGAAMVYGSGVGRDNLENLSSLGANKVMDPFAKWQAFLWEAIFTGLLVAVVLSSTHKESRIGNMAPFYIGSMVMLAHLVLIPVTNCSINPARSFGPAVISNEWDDHWVFWVGPLAGAVVVGAGNRFLADQDVNLDLRKASGDQTEPSAKMMWASLLRAGFVEMGLLAVFVLIGCGSVVTGNAGKQVSITHVAFAFGFCIAVLVASSAHLSGAHINPAVTISLLVAGRIEWQRCVVYIPMQLVGGIIGAAVLRLLCLGHSESLLHYDTLGSNLLSDTRGFTVWQGLLVEGLLTTLLVTVALSVTHDIGGLSNDVVPLYIGMAVLIAHFVAIGATGCGINPARSFGPAVVSNTWDDHWVFWVGPLAGGLAAALFYRFAPMAYYSKDAKNSNDDDDDEVHKDTEPFDN